MLAIVMAYALASTVDEADARLAAEMLAAALKQDERVVILTDARACGGPECLAAVAASTQADLIVFGDLRRLGRRVVLTANVFDPKARVVRGPAQADARAVEKLDLEELPRLLLADVAGTPRPRVVVLALRTDLLALEDVGDGPPALGIGLTAGGALGVLAGGGVVALSMLDDTADDPEARLTQNVTGATGAFIAVASALSMGVGAYFLLEALPP